MPQAELYFLVTLGREIHEKAFNTRKNVIIVYKIKPRIFFEDKMGVNLEYFQIRMFRLSQGRAGSLFELECCTRLKFMLHFLNNQ